MRKTRFAVLGVAMVALCILAASAQAQNSITTVAGGGPNNVSATTASIGYPWGVARYNGNTYISDSLSSRVFKVASNGTLTIVAGDTLAGNTGDYDPANPQAQPATLASLNRPEGIAVDAAGNVYIADTNSNAIRVLNTGGSTITIAGVQIGAGAISTVAGCVVNVQSCTTNENSSAQNVALSSPGGVALDAAGNIYIADTLDHAIRVVNTQNVQISFFGGAVVIDPGNIATVAGTLGNAGSSGDGGASTNATLTSPNDVFLDSSDNIYIADTNNSAIRVVNTQGAPITLFGNLTIQPGNIDTVAGTLATKCDLSSGPPFCGDGGPSTSAQLNFPTGLFVDGSGNIFIADTDDSVVRKVDGSTGDIDVFVGEYFSCNTVPCGDGDLAINGQLAFPSGVAVDSTSNDIYIADQNDNAVRVVTNDENISTIAGPLATMFDLAFFGDGGPATNGELYQPSAVAVDNSGNVLIADTFNNVIRKVDATSGNISTLVGKPEKFCGVAPCGDGGPTANAFLSFPSDVFVNGSGNIFIADYQPAAGGSPGVAVIREVAGSNINTVAGNYSGPGFSGDGGPALQAQLGGPTFGNTPPLSLFVDKAGIVYVVDGLNQRIRVVNTQTSGSITVAGVTIAHGNIDTVAGNGTAGYNNDGIPALNAELNNPSGVAVDRLGNIYIADTTNNRVRKVDNTSGIITTVAGDGTACATQGCGDGGLATAAELDAPVDLLVDFAGNVFIADTADFAVREVTAADSLITTIAGAQKRGFGGDGTGGLLASPFGLSSDASGDIYIADFGQWRIRKVAGFAATAPTATPAPTSLPFSSRIVSTTSSVQTVTITNNANLTAFTISSIAITGANNGDFAIASSSTCAVGPLAAGDSCTVDVTFTPTATGSRAASLTITDTPDNIVQNVGLAGTGQDFTIAGTAPAPVSAGGAAVSTISIAPTGGYNYAVTLSCTNGLPSGATCSFTPSSITPPQTSTLTITTTAASASLTAPAIGHRSSPMYAVWLLLPAMLLSTAGMAAPKRRKLVGYILLFLALAGLLFLIACGGSSSNNGGGGGGGGGTPPGSYSVTVTATPAAGAAHTTTVTLTVQ